MASFDITSQPNLAEIPNAMAQAQKELDQRYDFKGSNTELEVEQDGKNVKGVWIRSADDYKVGAARDVLFQKFAKRGIDLKFFDQGDIEVAPGGRAKMFLTLKQGVSSEVAKEIIAYIKSLKMKVTVANRGDEVRVTGNKIDDLQQIIGLLKEKEFGIPLGYENFR